MTKEAARKALEGKAFYPSWQGMLMVRDQALLAHYRTRLARRAFSSRPLEASRMHLD
jgi:hypothetical protein